MTIDSKSSEYDHAISQYNELTNTIKGVKPSEALIAVKEFTVSDNWKHLNFTQRFDLYALVSSLSVTALDNKTALAAITLAKQQLKLGTDFERSNKLHIIEGVYMIYNRKFKEAAELLIESIPTFNCDDFISIEKCVVYSVFAELLAYSRSDFKATIVSSSTIRQITLNIPYLDQLIQSYVKCEFSNFMDALSVVFMNNIENDHFIGHHAIYVLSQARLVIYSQYMSAFSSIKVSQMAESFGISEELLREDIYAFAAHSNLDVRIEGEYIYTTEIDVNEKVYNDITEMGDSLVLRIRRLLPLVK